MGRSTARAIFSCPLTSFSCWSHRYPVEIWMKRTPDSAKRRASRHCRPKSSVSGVPMPYSLSVAADSRDSSSTEGAADCMRKASSYDCTVPSIWAIVFGPLEVRQVQLLDQVELPSLHCWGKLVIEEKGDRGVLDWDVSRADGRSLIDGRQERAGIILHAAVRTRRCNGDEAGQVTVFGPQSVRDPRPERRSDEIGGPRVQSQGGLSMGPAFGVHAVDDAQVVHVLGDVREQLGDPATASPCWANFHGVWRSSGGFFLGGPSGCQASTKGAGLLEYFASVGL